MPTDRRRPIRPSRRRYQRYGAATNVRAFDGKPGELTEMDALVAYLQILGKLTDAAHKHAAGKVDHGQ